MSGFWSTETLEARIPTEGLIDPYDSNGIANCAYELRLGAEAYVTSDESKVKRTLQVGEQVRIPPGQFANLLTEETVKIPADSLGLLSAKFTWKQRGLVNVSGFHVDPGYKGRILFSVFNAGPTPVIIARGDRLFLLWYCSLDQITADLYSKEPRNNISSSDIAALQGDVTTPQALIGRIEALERAANIGKWLAAAIVGAIISTTIALGIQAATSTHDSPSPSPSNTIAPAPSIKPFSP